VNGPEHYREAERLLAESMEPATLTMPEPVGEVTINPNDRLFVIDDGIRVTDMRIAAAQVHATLALAAASAASLATAYDGDESYARSRGWAGVA
jgi:hypothetical protein